MSVKTAAARFLARRRWLAALAALLLMVLVATWWVAAERQGGTGAAVAPGPVGHEDESAGTADAAADGEQRPASATGLSQDSGADGDQAREPGAGLGELVAADPGRRLIRDGSVTVGYPETFDAAYRQVVELAQQLGGGVRDVESTTGPDGVVRGAVTVEVPVGDYDALLEGVTDVGRVRRRDVRTEDVTEQYVDLESRLRHLERTEQFYLDLFDRAESVDDVIRVRDRLDSVQQRIEEIQGRLRRLEQRTEMSRLTVELVPADAELDDDTPVAAGFGQYWNDARAAFVSVAGTLLVVAVGGAPLVLVAAVVLAGAVALLRAWRSASVTQPE